MTTNDMIETSDAELALVDGGNACWTSLLAAGPMGYFWCRYWGEIASEVMRDYPEGIV